MFVKFYSSSVTIELSLLQIWRHGAMFGVHNYIFVVDKE